MALFCLWIFNSTLGTVLVMRQISVKDKLERKKYMGVWRWESKLTAMIMSRFPSTVTRYMHRKRPKRRSCSSGSSVNPRRKNSEGDDWFLYSVILMNMNKYGDIAIKCMDSECQQCYPHLILLYTVINTKWIATCINLQILGVKKSIPQQGITYFTHTVTDIDNFILVYCNPKAIMKSICLLIHPSLLLLFCLRKRCFPLLIQVCPFHSVPPFYFQTNSQPSTVLVSIFHYFFKIIRDNANVTVYI